MMVRIPNVLTADQVARCREVMLKAAWVDGKVTAGHQSSQVKNNLQLPENSPDARELGGMVMQALASGITIRTDVSSTLFVSAPEDYDGGELVVEDTYGRHSVKLPAGDMIVYPATSLHHVTPITRGSRIASFFWTQSMIRDESKRALLFDLDMAIMRLGGDHPEHASVVDLTAVYHNLLRQWAEV